tara:strand:- start:941 stop:1801 length:861 start_codon:yes stop_codon:yes gene_type:complete
MRIINTLFLLCFFTTFSQVKTPQASPKSKLIQNVGLTEITIEYFRPSIKGRNIMSDLVPYGEIWRTGANNISTITFNDQVAIDNKLIPKGKYSLLTKPNKKSWDIYLLKHNKDKSVLNIIKNWDEQIIISELNIPVISTNNKVETFAIDINDITNNGANINLSWENTLIKIPVDVLSKQKVLESIKEIVMNDPNAYDLYNSASYYLQEEEDLNLAKKWINKAIEIDSTKYWMFRLQAVIHNKLNLNKDAIIAAKKGLELAKKAENNDHIRMNLKSIQDWGKLVSSN